ncbi:ATP-binding protein [Emticicia sediminis]
MKITHFLLSLFFLIALIPNCKANSESDSLAILLQKMPKDTNYVREAEQYAWKLLNYLDDEKKAEKILRVAEKLAVTLNDYKGIVHTNWYLGYLYVRFEKIDEAIKYFRKAELFVDKYKLSPNERQKVYSGLGICYDYISQFDKAAKYLSQAIELTEKHNLNDYVLHAYLVLAVIYRNIDVEKYITFTQKIEKIKDKEKVPQLKYLAELALATHYTTFNDFKKAKYHALNSYSIAKKYCHKISIIPSWLVIGNTYIAQKQLDSAYIYINQSIKLSETLKNELRMADSYSSMGLYYEKKKQYQLAEKYFLKTLEIDKKRNYGLETQLDYKKLADLNVLLNNYKRAYDFRVQAYKLNDSLFSTNLTMKVNALEMEKKDIKFKLLETENKNSIFQRNALLFGGIISILFAIISIVLIINRNKYKKLEAEQRLRNQIAADLHDEIGSTLSSISILSEIVAFQQKKGDSKLEIMQQVSSDAREVIDKMDDIIWTINPQNDSLHNLETRLKTYAIPIFESKEIEFNIDFSAISDNIKIDISKRRDIYLILKEAINNLVKYSNSKNAVIGAKFENKFIVFEIVDNGIGFDINAESQRNGLKNMKMRADKIGAILNINSIIGKGTQVILNVPL